MSTLEDYLCRVEPGVAPSQRYNRRVQVGGVYVLEMRDPNSGSDPEPATKPRHQYVRTAGMIWYRDLPPETVGDAWLDRGVPQWRPVKGEAYTRLHREMFSVIPKVGLAVIERLRLLVDGDEKVFVVGGKRVPATVDNCGSWICGPITDSVWDVTLIPCPDCGGDLVWWEHAYAPGTRKCMGDYDHENKQYHPDNGCGSLFTLITRD